jgi:hypothetical protein
MGGRKMEKIYFFFFRAIFLFLISNLYFFPLKNRKYYKYLMFNILVVEMGDENLSLEELRKRLAGWWKAPDKEIYAKWVNASSSNGGKVKFVVWIDNNKWGWKMRGANGFYPRSPATYENILCGLLGIRKKELEEHDYSL